MNILVYDIEIIKAIPPKDDADRIEGIKYCNGWRDFAGMGIACIAYQINDEPVDVSLSAQNFKDVIAFHWQGFRAIGFNSIGFDDKLLAANHRDGFQFFKSDYDLLVEVRAAAGYQSYKDVPQGHTYKLDAIAQANGMAKTGTGELAPIMWQCGQWKEVIEYAKNDVVVTRKLLDLGLAGELVDPNTGEKLKLREIE
jgi:hypothetical protein